MANTTATSPRRFQFRITRLLGIMLLCGTVLGWWFERRQLGQLLESRDTLIKQIGDLQETNAQLLLELNRSQESNQLAGDRARSVSVFLEQILTKANDGAPGERE